MTQYTDVIKKRQLELAAEEWGKQVKMVIGENGYVIYHFNNGNKWIINSTTHKKTWEYANTHKKSLIEKFEKFLIDNKRKIIN